MRISSPSDWACSESCWPKLSRFAVLARATSPATAQYVKEAELAAQTLRRALARRARERPR